MLKYNCGIKRDTYKINSIWLIILIICNIIFIERVIFMTLKQYILELSQKIHKQWQGQINLESRLKSRLSSIEERIASGKTTDDRELKQLEMEIEILENVQPKLRETAKYVHSCSERIDSDLRHTQSEKIKGNRGNTVLEDVYQMDDDMTFTQRNTTINGRKYSFIKTTMGKQTAKMDTPYAEIKEGFENGERTYYESYANDGPYERIDTELAYDDVTTKTPSGIEVQTKKRNPAKDCTRREIRDYENGTTITIDRPIVDNDGHIMGSYSFKEQQNTHKLGEEYFKKTTVVESKCKDKDGNEVVLKSVIKDNGKGFIAREDYMNGQMITQVIMNNDAGFMAITNFQDGQKVNWAHYEGHDGEWYMDKEKHFYKGTDVELDEEDITGDVRTNPYELNFEQPEDLFYSQAAFLDGAYIPEELQDLLLDESFSEEATGRGYIRAEYELADTKMKALKETQQPRKPTHNRGPNEKEWD